MTATKKTLGGMEEPPPHLLGRAAVQPTENNRETVHSSIIAKWLLVKKQSPGPFTSSLRPVLLFLSACSPKCGYSCSHFPRLHCKRGVSGDGTEKRRVIMT